MPDVRLPQVLLWGVPRERAHVGVPLRPDAERAVDEHGRRVPQEAADSGGDSLGGSEGEKSASTRLLAEVEEKMEERKLHPGSHDHMDRHRSESDSRVLSEGDVSEA